MGRKNTKSSKFCHTELLDIKSNCNIWSNGRGIHQVITPGNRQEIFMWTNWFKNTNDRPCNLGWLTSKKYAKCSPNWRNENGNENCGDYGNSCKPEPRGCKIRKRRDNEPCPYILTKYPHTIGMIPRLPLHLHRNLLSHQDHSTMIMHTLHWTGMSNLNKRVMLQPMQCPLPIKPPKTL